MEILKIIVFFLGIICFIILSFNLIINIRKKIKIYNYFNIISIIIGLVSILCVLFMYPRAPQITTEDIGNGEICIKIFNPNDMTPIFYTEDGELPTKSSKKYVNPIIVNDNIIFRAIAIDWFTKSIMDEKIVNITTNSNAKLIDVINVSLNRTSLSLIVGNSETIIASVSPSDATDKSITWLSDNTSVATVINGKITAINEGNALITAKSSNNKSISCNVIVNEELFEKVDFSETGKFIKFEDNVVEARIREILDIPSPNEITLNDMLKVKEFTYVYYNGFENNQISTINDLRYCRDLEMIDITNQKDIKDIESLRFLLNLKKVTLFHCNIFDFSPLASHNKIELIWIIGNPVEDVSMLLCLPELKSFNALYGTNIKNISAIRSDSKIENLIIGYTGINDISVLENMEFLKELSLCNTDVPTDQIYNTMKTLNLISLDLEGLGLGNDIFDSINHMKDLKFLNLNYNNISSIPAIKNFIILNDLRLVGNNIIDISPIKELLYLTYNLDLRDNKIIEIIALKNVSPDLNILLDGNDIKDWSPIAHVKNVSGKP